MYLYSGIPRDRPVHDFPNLFMVKFEFLPPQAPAFFSITGSDSGYSLVPLLPINFFVTKFDHRVCWPSWIFQASHLPVREPWYTMVIFANLTVCLGWLPIKQVTGG